MHTLQRYISELAYSVGSLIDALLRAASASMRPVSGSRSEVHGVINKDRTGGPGDNRIQEPKPQTGPRNQPTARPPTKDKYEISTTGGVAQNQRAKYISPASSVQNRKKPSAPRAEPQPTHKPKDAGLGASVRTASGHVIGQTVNRIGVCIKPYRWSALPGTP